MKSFHRWHAFVWIGVALVSFVCGNSALPAAPASSTKIAATREAPYVNTLGMKFVPLPRSKVLVSVWETRSQDFRAFTDSLHIASPRTTTANSPTHPASGVSWNDTVAFCQWLTAKERGEGKIGPQDQYRLPTDVEWDRAAGLEKYPWGNKWPNLSEWSKLPGHYPGNGDNLAKVGSSPANRLGLHDIGGNVFEWVDDWYDRKSNPKEIRLEYKRLDDDRGGKTYKVLRGASWVLFDPMNLLLEYRYPNTPDNRSPLYGFRCVLEPESAKPLPVAFTKPKPFAEIPAVDARARAGREVFSGKCRECHQLFDPALYADDDWADWMMKMAGKAKLSESERGDINHFLRTIRPAKP